MHALRQVIDGIDPPAGLVRTGFRCNQDCGLCWQGRDWGDYGAAQVRIWMEDLAAGGVRDLTISGGEPTLDPEISPHIAYAKALGFRTIALETNAIQMAKPGFAQRLRDAGLTECFVSLHSADAAVSDAITRAPGTHAKTVKGVQALLLAGVPVVLNAVMTAEGLATLPALPDFVRDAFGATELVRGLVLSFPTMPFERSLLDSIVPEPEPRRAALRPAIARALELGLDLGGVAGPGGVPLCAFESTTVLPSGVNLSRLGNLPVGSDQTVSSVAASSIVTRSRVRSALQSHLPSGERSIASGNLPKVVVLSFVRATRSSIVTEPEPMFDV